MKYRGFDEPVRLCELDASAWTRFGEQACFHFARQIIAELTPQASRIRAVLDNEPLPAVPAEIRLRDLQLETRTFNRLHALWQGRPMGRFAGLTIGNVMRLRTFGVRSLVDLLTSLESFGLYDSNRTADAPCKNDHSPTCPEVDRLLGYARSTPRLPEHILGSPIPPLPPGVRLRDIGLQPATRAALMRAGVWAKVEDLADFTIRDVMALDRFGPSRLLDLLECVGRVRGRSGYTAVCSPDRKARALSPRRYSLDEVREALNRLKAVPNIGPLGRGDPRLHPWLKTIDPDLQSVESLCNASDHFLATRDVDRIAEFCKQVEQWTQEDYQTELLGIVLSKRRKERDAAIVKSRFCLEGQGPTTLDALGRQYGLTRERIRQLCSPARRARKAPPPFAPALDRLIHAVKEQMPCPAAGLEKALLQQGLLSRGALLDGLMWAAKGLGREPGFDVLGHGVHRVIFPADQSKSASDLRLLLGKASWGLGIANVDAMCYRAALKFGKAPDRGTVELVVQSIDGFRQLDSEGRWFLVGHWGRAGLARRVREVLAAADSLTAAELRAALRRDHLLRHAVPPEEWLVQFCEMLTECHVDQGRITLKPSHRPKRESRAKEAVLVGLIRHLGPVCTSEQLLDAAFSRFLSANAVWRCLQNCPMIEWLGPGQYALRSSGRGPAADLPGPKRGNAALAYGQRAPGHVWAVYRATQEVVTRGCLPVPAAIADRVAGTFELRWRPGLVMGRIAAERGRLSGLESAFRYLAVEPDDVIRVEWHIDRGVMLLRVGDQSLLDEVAADEFGR